MLNKENAHNMLFDLRCKYGKTQEDVSLGSGISRATINRIENGKTDGESLRAETFFKLNEYFKGLGKYGVHKRQGTPD
jgi:transcriptional regulator with XRE-family HTH domain